MHGLTPAASPTASMLVKRPCFLVIAAWWRMIMIVIVITAAGITHATEPPRKTHEQRVQDIRKIGSLLAEYTAAKKATPYAEEWQAAKEEEGYEAVPLICNLTLPTQTIPESLAYPPFSCALLKKKDLEQYLSDALGRKITLPVDDRPLK